MISKAPQVMQSQKMKMIFQRIGSHLNGKKVSVLDLWLSFRKKGWELRYLNKKTSVRFVTNFQIVKKQKQIHISKPIWRVREEWFIFSSWSISVTDEERWFYQGWFHQSGSRPNRNCEGSISRPARLLWSNIFHISLSGSRRLGGFDWLFAIQS